MVRLRYLLFNKPFNVLSQFTREEGRRQTLADFIPVKDVYAAGRLDLDSEGLLLLTNDGALQHRLTDPRYGHPRTYWAQVEGQAGPSALDALRSGVTIQGYRTLPAEVRLILEPKLPPRDPPIRVRKHIPTSWIELILTEGRNRQVRRMTASVGLPTLRLIRCAIGPCRLQGLEVGKWRELSSIEKRAMLLTKKGDSMFRAAFSENAVS